MTNYILVTGGAGYIGSVCVELLINRGYSVVVIDNLKTGHHQAVHSKATFIKANIGNKSALSRLFDKFPIDTVIHFAAETLVTNANSSPQKYYHNNISSGLNMLDMMINKKVEKIIYSSSAAVYGDPQETPISESHPLNPKNAYGDTKLFFESVLQRYSEAYGLKYISFRYFNPAGASIDYGEQHDTETHLIPLALQVAQGKKKDLNIFGSDYNTRDGTCIRDYIHVLDVAEAHILAIEKMNSLSGSVFNLGSQTGFTVKEVVETAERVTGKNISTVIKGRREGDPEKLVASAVKARTQLGWLPKHPKLKEIIESAWEWEKNHHYRY